MLRRITRTCLLGITVGLVGFGCYQETTLDQINQVPSTKPASARRPQRPDAPKPAARPAPKTQPADPEVTQLSRRTKSHADRVATGLERSPSGKTTARRPDVSTPTTRQTAPKPATPKKLATHVDEDSIELGRSAIRPRSSTRRPETKPPSATPQGKEPSEKKPTLPEVQPPKPTKKVDKPSPAPAPTKTSVDKPSPAPTPTPKTKLPELPELGKKPTPTTAAPAKKPEPAKPTPPSAKKKVDKPSGRTATKPPPKPTPSKKPASAEPKPATPAEKTAQPSTGAPFEVPKPPKLITEPAKTEREKQLAKRTEPVPPTPSGVSVRAAKADKKPSGSLPTVGANRPAKASSVKASLDAMIEAKRKEVLSNPNDIRKQIALRMLYLADNQPKKALAEIPNTHAPVQEILERLMDVNVAATNCSGRDRAADATALLSEVEELRQSLTGYADLKVTSVKLVRQVSSFGVYQEITPRVFPAGQKTKAIVYCELENFKALPTEDSKYRVLLSEKITVLNEDGDAVFETTDDIAHKSQSRFYDLYLVRLVELPATQPPGKYLVRVTVEDKQAAKVAEGQIDLVLTRR